VWTGNRVEMISIHQIVPDQKQFIDKKKVNSYADLLRRGVKLPPIWVREYGTEKSLYRYECDDGPDIASVIRSPHWRGRATREGQ
jgi:hypothetical protein